MIKKTITQKKSDNITLTPPPYHKKLIPTQLTTPDTVNEVPLYQNQKHYGLSLKKYCL